MQEMSGGEDLNKSLNLTVRDKSETSDPSYDSAIRPVILSVIFIITAAILGLVYVFKKNARKRKSQKFEDIKDDILRHAENVEVKREVENSFEDPLQIPGSWY